MINTKHLISRGMNRKLTPGGIVVFNLPAGETCGMECPDCYSIKTEKLYKSAREKRAWNLIQSQMPDFVPRMVAEMTTGHCKKNQILRLHEGGEVYSQAYLDKLTEIADGIAPKTVYMYTKRLKDWDWTAFRSLANTVVIDSCHFGPINYGDKAQVAAWVAAGALVCPASKTITCNKGCDLCTNPVHKWDLESCGLVFHKH